MSCSTLCGGVLAVATLDDFEARAVEAQRAFRHQKNALIVVLTHTASWGEPGPAVQIHAHAFSLAG